MSARLGRPVRCDELAALRGGDDEALARLVRRHHPAMMLVALTCLRARAAAEAAVQGTWRVVIAGLAEVADDDALFDRIFAVLAERVGGAPFADRVADELTAAEPAVAPGRFLGPGCAWSGWWDDPPQPLPGGVWGAMLPGEVAVIERALASMGPGQRTVVTLRDVEGWDSGRVSRALRISQAEQRVLLHRARSAVRRALEDGRG